MLDSMQGNIFCCSRTIYDLVFSDFPEFIAIVFREIKNHSFCKFRQYVKNVRIYILKGLELCQVKIHNSDEAFFR